MVPSLTPYDLPSPLHMLHHTRMGSLSLQRVIRSTSCLVLWYRVFGDGGSNGAIYGLNKIQDGGHRHVGNISSGDIFATGRPINFMFVLGDGVFGDGGSNGAIFDSNKLKMAAAAILVNFEWPYLRNGSRYLYSAHRAVIFTIAQLSCY